MVRGNSDINNINILWKIIKVFVIPQITVLYKLKYYIMNISIFEIIKTNGIRWANKHKYNLLKEFNASLELVWLCEVFKNNEIEKIEVISEIKMNGIKIKILKLIRLVRIKISPARLIDGGAEILAAMKINHQNVILGNEFHNPLKEIIFRVWCFV